MTLKESLLQDIEQPQRAVMNYLTDQYKDLVGHGIFESYEDYLLMIKGCVDHLHLTSLE